MKNLRHVGIVVGDMKRALHFYRDLLGLNVTADLNESGDYIDNMLKLNSVRVRTVKLSSDRGKGLVELLFFKSHRVKGRKVEPISMGPTHIAFEVYNLDREYKELKKNGVIFNAPPQYSPNGIAKVTFCKDPEGTLIELVEILKK
jgi:catechol 2,3-dioxygenase-like lactoylglutathione lyase family enzyme